MQHCAKSAPPTARASPITKAPSTTARASCCACIDRTSKSPASPSSPRSTNWSLWPVAATFRSWKTWAAARSSICGPQAGLISGRADLVGRMRSNSLFRALRVDKLTYAALEATLLAYVKRDHDAVPVLRMLRLSKDEITSRVKKIVSEVKSAQLKHLKLELLDGESVVGGGAAPSAVLPTRLIALCHTHLSADELNARLRASTPPVVARLEEGRVLIDLRTVFPEQDAVLIETLHSLG